MAKNHKPQIDHWYQDSDDRTFKVIALDDDDAIEIQYFDGAIEEIDTDTWIAMEVEGIEPPEDWSGPFDDLDQEDIDFSSEIHQPDAGDWQTDISNL